MSKPVPHGPFESSLPLMREGYTFAPSRHARLRSDLFLTRLMLRRAVCIHGPDAAKIFYDESKMQRAGALPRRIVTSLFGKKAIHTLDGEKHRQRKSAFMSLMSPENMGRLTDIAAEEWRRAIARWEGMGQLVLMKETQQLLTRAICRWTGVPLEDGDVKQRAHDLAGMVDAFGGVGPRLWRGKWARHRTEKWIAGVIEKVHAGTLQAPVGSALQVMTHHTDMEKKPLDTRTAAVELINVLRPTVAISWYITFAALALHDHPESAERLREEGVEGTGGYAEWFMQEVRRFYPFVPILGAKVKSPFEWGGHRFEEGTMVVLDVYGTNHDARTWERPEVFEPERFESWHGDPFNFIPQGGGGVNGHRCPREWITMYHVVLALHFLTRGATYRVAEGQNLRVDLRRMPARPASGMILEDVKRTAALEGPVPRLPSCAAERGRVSAQAGDSALPGCLARS